jgi:succinate dehydrogenase/fumarate reductase cytochrome b subunit
VAAAVVEAADVAGEAAEDAEETKARPATPRAIRAAANGPPEPAWVALADRLQMASGLFLGLYVVAHLVHQATAAIGRAAYEAYAAAVNGWLIDRRLDLLFVWLPLLVHLGATAALRIHSREIRGSLRKRLSVWTGYAVLLILPLHVWGTRIAPAESNGYDLIVHRLSEVGVLFYGYLIVFSALAVVHVAAGTINSVHQVVRDRGQRTLLDRAIIGVTGLLFLAVLAGVFAFRSGG